MLDGEVGRRPCVGNHTLENDAGPRPVLNLSLLLPFPHLTHMRFLLPAILSSEGVEEM